MRPEQALESRLVREATSRGWLAYKFTAPSTAGVPDRILITPQHTLFVEVKGSESKPRPSQIKVMADINAAGGCATWVGSNADITALITALETNQPIPQRPSAADFTADFIIPER